jgi:methylase of polypeptide subunit release factors
MAADVPDGSDREALRALRAALDRAGFTAEAVEERLGTGELSSRPADVATHLRRLEDDDAFATLARAFLLGADVPADRLADAAGLPAERLAALGLVALDGGLARAQARLVPHGEYVVASDGGTEGADVPYDHVPGIQAPSVTLAKLAVRRPCARALDLGTGCGIQALLAARHAERVVATDVNPRALAFTSFNAALNGIDTVELREGDGFEPVAGERFDLIVANPPYVISPDAAYAYRDSGLPADELCRRVVAGASERLAEGGFAHVLVSWALADADVDWATPLRAWVDGSGCDAWLLHYRTSDPVAHAAGWLRPLADTDPPAFAVALDRWLDHLRAHGIGAVGYGAVVLRRREGANWVRTDPLPLDRLEPASAHTLRVFAAQDALERLEKGGLLTLPLVLTPAHRLDQALVARDGALVVESQTLELTEGLGFTVGIDRHTASLLRHFDGRRPLGEVLDRARDTFELEPDERDRFVPAALPVVRRLLALGFLELRD